jgi:hypothetical protein
MMMISPRVSRTLYLYNFCGQSQNIITSTVNIFFICSKILHILRGNEITLFEQNFDHCCLLNLSSNHVQCHAW